MDNGFITTWIMPSTKNQNIANVRRFRRSHSFLFKSWNLFHGHEYLFIHEAKIHLIISISAIQNNRKKNIPIWCILKKIRIFGKEKNYPTRMKQKKNFVSFYVRIAHIRIVLDISLVLRIVSCSPLWYLFSIHLFVCIVTQSVFLIRFAAVHQRPWRKVNI